MELSLWPVCLQPLPRQGVQLRFVPHSRSLTHDSNDTGVMNFGTTSKARAAGGHEQKRTNVTKEHLTNRASQATCTKAIQCKQRKISGLRKAFA